MAEQADNKLEHADDVLYIPAGVPRFYAVIEAPFEFLCMVPDEVDRVTILDADC